MRTTQPCFRPLTGHRSPLAGIHMSPHDRRQAEHDLRTGRAAGRFHLRHCRRLAGSRPPRAALARLARRALASFGAVVIAPPASRGQRLTDTGRRAAPIPDTGGNPQHQRTGTGFVPRIAMRYRCTSTARSAREAARSSSTICAMPMARRRSPYSLRARKSAPVAAPVDWAALDDDIRFDFFSVRSLPTLLDRKDPWSDFAKVRQTVTAAMRKRVAG